MAAVAAAAETAHITMSARAAPHRHLSNRHAMLVSGSDSYALLFFCTNCVCNFIVMAEGQLCFAADV